jgi:hypothetical protein
VPTTLTFLAFGIAVALGKPVADQAGLRLALRADQPAMPLSGRLGVGSITLGQARARGDEMKRAVTWGLGLYVLCALIGRLVEERMDVVRCTCAEDCWCRRPGLSAFRWVFPLGHRTAERVFDAAPTGGEKPPAETRRTPRYWLYKKKNGEGTDPFTSTGEIEWFGHYSTRSAEVARTLNEDVAVGDVVVAYQTDLKGVTGYLQVSRIEGPRDDKKLFVRPIHRVDPPFLIHEHKAGTSLANSGAVGGMVMLRELSAEEMRELVQLSGAPARVLFADEPQGARR